MAERLYSMTAVKSGLVRDPWMLSIIVIPNSVGTSSLPFFVMQGESDDLPDFVAINSLMIVSLVAGVPNPLHSFSFSLFGLSGDKYLQMFVMAASNVPSV